ncbi:hypothetical protein [Azospirillum sp. sgz302134]
MDALSSSGLPSPQDMVASLQQSIDNAVKNIQAQAAAPQASDNVQDFQKTVDKSTIHTQGFATDIGILVNNTSRLNVVSQLQANDPADFFKFRVTSSGPITLGKVGDDGSRVQMLSTYGLVLADSDPNAGDAYEAFKQMQQGDYDLQAGSYAIRVTRTGDVDAKQPLNYAIQLSQGSGYSQDYDTIAKAAQPSDNPFQMPSSTLALVDMLNGGSQAAQAFGGGGQSVLGIMFNGTF